MKNTKNEKGAFLLLTILVLTAILAIAFGVVNLMIGEIKISQEVPKSLKAYYAAETGIERSLYDARWGAGANDIGSPPNCSGDGAVCLDESETCYSIDIISGDPTIIKAYGCYRGIRRAITVSY